MVQDQLGFLITALVLKLFVLVFEPFCLHYLLVNVSLGRLVREVGGLACKLVDSVVLDEAVIFVFLDRRVE